MPMISDSPKDWTVLVVDDMQDNAEVICKVLTYLGAQTVCTMDGMAGLQALSTMTPSFILLDLSMPQMDGWEMLKQIRQDPQNKDMLVIAVTAHAMGGEMEKAIAAGFNSYITKPFTMATLTSQIQEAIKIYNQRFTQ